MRHGARRCPPDVQQLPTVGPQRRDGAAIGPGRLDRSRPPWTGPGDFAQAGEQLSKMLL